MNSMYESPALLSTILELSSSKDFEASSFAGRAVHAWFLQQVQSRNSALAAELHNPNTPRPFTISDLWGPGVQTHQGKRRILQNHPIYLRITSMTSGLTTFLLDQLLPALPNRFHLDGVNFAVKQAMSRPAQVSDQKLGAWVGVTTYEEYIASRAFHPAPLRRLRLHFAAPTVFKSDGKYALLPTPRLVFESLARRWNLYAPVAMHPDIVAFVEANVVVSSYQLRTSNIPLGGNRGVIPGFVGKCTYAIRHADAYWLNNLHLLAAFALYAGVGKNTAMGLGQTRLVESERV